MAVKKIEPVGVTWKGKGRAHGSHICGIAFLKITPGTTNREALEHLRRIFPAYFSSRDIRCDLETRTTHRFVVIQSYQTRRGDTRWRVYCPNVLGVRPVGGGML
jgi:hypothetical protein